MTSKRSLLTTFSAVATATFLLAACSSVGKGNRPVSAAIQPDAETVGKADTTAYVCIPKRLNFLLTFTNGERGNYVNQAKWTSSDTARLRVSNGDIAIPDGSGAMYASGVMVPQAATGTATVTAEYLGFKQSINVTTDNVGTPRIVPAQLDLAPGSFGVFTLLGELNGVTTQLAPNWTFLAPDTTVANITRLGGVVSATGKASSPVVNDRKITAQAELIGCPTGISIKPTADVNVSVLKILMLTQEFSSNNLVVGTTEKMTATGTLTNNAKQDLTQQVEYTASDTSLVSLLSSDLYGYLKALKASTTSVTVSAVFRNTIDNPSTTIPSNNTLSITPIDATLMGISITPPSTPTIIAAGSSANFVSTGTFSPATAPTTSITQPNTRDVKWESSDTASILIATSTASVTNVLAGLAFAPTTAVSKTSVTITASPIGTITPCTPGPLCVMNSGVMVK